jgi:GTP cyclohydrolase I
VNAVAANPKSAYYLQIQECLTSQIVQAVRDTVNAIGVDVVMAFRHLCMMMRGVEKQNSVITTSLVLGELHSDASSRAKFLIC